MKLKKLTVKNLHGHINQEVSFFDDLSLLVGINGCGKTSVLNIADWLLRFDLVRLVTTCFDEATLVLQLSGDDSEISLHARQTEKQLVLEVLPARQDFQPITVDFHLNPREFGANVDLKSLFLEYEGLSAEEHEKKTWAFWEKLKKPVVITLDRALSNEIGSYALFIEEQKVGRASRRTRLVAPTAPVAKVKEVTAARYGQYIARAGELNERLKAKIVMSAFSTPLSQADYVPKTPTREAVTRLEEKVLNLVSPSTKGELERKQIAAYFHQVRERVSGNNAASRSPEVLDAQFSQVEALADAFDEFDRESATAYEPVRKFLETVNRFFVDSGKCLYFAPPLNTLSFRTTPVETGELANDAAQNRDIEWLSSGERQILVLFTFLAFIAAESSVFIIDEPELSLHPKWQLDFLAALLELKPNGTQLLLATHSPEIVANHKSRCIVLRNGGAK